MVLCVDLFTDFCGPSYSAYDANITGMKDENTILASCTDLFRPVIFKIERVAV